MNNNLSKLLKAIEFAADKHKYQNRKDAEKIPYINHPIKVANTLIQVGKEENLELLVAAVLHDTIEDTDTKPKEIEEKFGKEVLDLVLETTDNKNLPKPVRKILQIKNATKKSDKAKKLQIADKICNVKDIIELPPVDWSTRRKLQYFDWAEKLVYKLRGVNPYLENLFDELIKKGRNKLQV